VESVCDLMSYGAQASGPPPPMFRRDADYVDKIHARVPSRRPSRSSNRPSFDLIVKLDHAKVLGNSKVSEDVLGGAAEP